MLLIVKAIELVPQQIAKVVAGEKVDDQQVGAELREFLFESSSDLSGKEACEEDPDDAF